MGWLSYLDVIVVATNNVFSITLTVLIAFHLASLLPPSDDTEDLPVFTVGMTALVNFVILAYIYPLTAESFGVNSILLAVAVGIGTTELLRWVCQQPRLNFIRIPYDAEEVFFHAMRASFPVILVGGITFCVSLLVAQVVPHKTDVSAGLVASRCKAWTMWMCIDRSAPGATAQRRKSWCWR